MRRFMQKKLSELIETIFDGVNYAVKEADNPDNTYNILLDCYAAVSSAGNILENNVSEFEEYNEIILSLQNALEDLNEAVLNKENINNPFKYIKKELLHLKNKIQKEKIKTEIVFLPYKAAMWDSLESIWKAAEEDESCNAVVIPIPYFDRNADYSLGTMHYEGNLFPDYVPITHYEKYNLEQHKPDVIYIHNPYDGYNYITSIHPAFYSSELKKYTDMLVYIPYFVVAEEMPKHFCNLPGDLNADKVIVQSEAVKKTYIDEFVSLMLKNNINSESDLRLFSEKKYCVLGSPKVDMALYYENNKPVLSPEWKKQICERTERNINDDISDIKLIFYNTHLDCLMNNGEKFLKKLKYVFYVFEKRKDVVLIWRPHPLSEATAASMRPKYLKEYEELIKKYKKNNIGIYDDTADFHTAMSLSDAYYGDPSSLVPLYALTNKPIYFQNLNIYTELSDEDMRSLAFEDIVIDGDKGYFSALNFNGLFEMDTYTKEVKFLGHFSKNDKYDFRLYSTIKKYKNKLYLVPMDSDYFAVYDIETNVFTEIPLDMSYYDNNEGKCCKFYSMACFDKYVFAVGCTFPAILRIDIETNEIKYFAQDIFSEIRKNNYEKFDFYFGKDIVVKNNIMMAASASLNCVLEFDMKTFKSNLHFINSSKESFSTLCYDGRNYWLAERESGSIIKWNKENNTLKRFEQNNSYFFSYINSFYKNGCIWLFPVEADSIIKINVETNNIEKINNFETAKYKESNLNIDCFSRFYFAKEENSVIIAFSSKNNVFMEYDTKTNKMRESRILCSKELYRQLNGFENQKDLRKKENIKAFITEDNFTAINDFLERLHTNNFNFAKNNISNTLNNLDKNCGKKIHENIKNGVYRNG